MHPHLVLLATLLSLAAVPNKAESAWINELFLGRETPASAGAPNAIELAGLGSYTQSTVELLIMDATPDRFGLVLQIVRIPVSEKLHLISDRDWPGEQWGNPLAGVPTAVTLDLASISDGAYTQFDFRGTRQIHLYDRPTNVQPGASLFTPIQQARLGEASRLDLLTFGPSDTTAHANHENMLNVNDGWVMARAFSSDGDETIDNRWLTGSPDIHGRLPGYEPDFRMTPGRMNPLWNSATVPEPSGAAVVLAGLWGLAGRRQQRPTVTK